MRILLALLMSFVLLQTQCFALVGGPKFGGFGIGPVTGTYAGVLVPSLADLDPLSSTDTGNSSLGLFTLGVPTTGAASGIAIYFTEGKAYAGPILGILDPNRATLRAIVKLQFNLTQTVIVAGKPAVVSFPGGFASGSISAKVVDAVSIVGAFGVFSTRIAGKAELGTQDADGTGNPIGTPVSLNLIVDGFKQSAEVGGTIDVSALTNTTAR